MPFPCLSRTHATTLTPPYLYPSPVLSLQLLLGLRICLLRYCSCCCLCCWSSSSTESGPWGWRRAWARPAQPRLDAGGGRQSKTASSRLTGITVKLNNQNPTYAEEKQSTTPYHATPHHVKPHHATSYYTVPNRAVSHRTVQNRAVSRHAVHYIEAPYHTVRYRTVVYRTIP